MNQERLSYIQEIRQGSTNIIIAIRVRPANSKELSASIDQETVKVLESKIIILVDPDTDSMDILKKNRAKDFNFAFDIVFDKTIDQKEVYEKTTLFLIDGVLNGYNTTVFAYGATGAGKTYTMTGSSDKIGIIPRTLEDLIQAVQRHKQTKDCESKLNCVDIQEVKVSYLEIYNEKIRDLLTTEDKNLELREDGKQGIVIAGIQEYVVKTTQEILNLLKIGDRNRAKEPTEANEHSTRSHAILQIQIQITIGKEIQTSKLSLVDLAGSERAGASNNRGMRMIEGAKINQSLLILGSCIQQLCKDKTRNGFIPYRGSKLTRLLKDSLGGNCRTIMIANVSPSILAFDDTFNTLSYANRAKNIKTNVNRNLNNVQDQIQNYTSIIDQLRLENEDLKKQLNEGQDLSIPHQISTLLPQITPDLHKMAYQDTKQQINSQYQVEKDVLQKLFDMEDRLDQAQLEVQRLEGVYASTKPKEREKLEDEIYHQQNRTQIMEIDLVSLNDQFKDLVSKRKLIQSIISRQDLGKTNGLLLQSLMKKNEKTIVICKKYKKQNLQSRQNDKRCDFQTKLKEHELESLQNLLQKRDNQDRRINNPMRNQISYRMVDKPTSVLPYIQMNKKKSSQNRKIQFKYQDHNKKIDYSQSQSQAKARIYSVLSLSPPNSSKDIDYNDYSLQEKQIVNRQPHQYLNKQTSLMGLPTFIKKKKNLQDEQIQIQEQFQFNEDDTKKLRLKRLNQRLKQKKYHKID